MAGKIALDESMIEFTERNKSLTVMVLNDGFCFDMDSANRFESDDMVSMNLSKGEARELAEYILNKLG